MIGSTHLFVILSFSIAVMCLSFSAVNIRTTKANINFGDEKEFNKGLYEEKVLFFDEDMIVVDKPPNIQTAPGVHLSSLEFWD